MYMFILTVSPDKYILLGTTKDMVVFEGGAHRPSRLYQRNWEED